MKQQNIVELLNVQNSSVRVPSRLPLEIKSVITSFPFAYQEMGLEGLCFPFTWAKQIVFCQVTH